MSPPEVDINTFARACKARGGLAYSFSPCSTGISAMTVHFQIVPIISLIAGVLILVSPKLLNYIVAIYLIIVGVIGLVPSLA